MDRASGWYKRRIKYILLILGFILSFILNIDTLQISQSAMKNKRQLKESADKIIENLNKYSIINDSSTATIKIDPIENKVYVNVSKETKVGSIDSYKDTGEKIILDYENVTGFNLGYTSYADFKNQFNSVSKFIAKMLGFLITAFALQLGSNYWFDILNKVASIRNTGKKP